jgi:hypothetical protein
VFYQDISDHKKSWFIRCFDRNFNQVGVVPKVLGFIKINPMFLFIEGAFSGIKFKEHSIERLAKVFFERLSRCNKRASRAAPWYSVFGKRLFITGDTSEAEKDNIMADGNAATQFVS